MAEKSFGVKEINLIGASGTPTIESPNNLNLNAVNVAISTNATIGGNLTVSGTVGIAGTLTYEDVTNVDAIGIVTAREGVFIPDSKKLQLGNAAGNADLEIVHDTNNSVIRDKGTGSLVHSASGIDFARYGTADYYARFTGGGKVDLRYNGNVKFETTNTGATVTGTLAATAVTGDGSGLTGIAVTEAPVTDYTITGDGGNYYFHGGGVDETAGDPDLYLIRGQKYRFNNTTGSNHPFKFRVSSGGSAYTDGITGDDEGVQFFTVPYAAPASIVYQCSIHSGMVGNIYIRGGSSTANISNNADNRVITGGSGGNLNAESNMTFDGDDLIISHSGLSVTKFESTDNHSRLRISSGDSSLTQLEFADQSDADAGEIRYDHGNDRMTIHVGNNTERLRIDSSGNITNGGAFTTNNFFSGGIHLKKQSDVGIKFQRTQSGDSQTWDWGVSSAGHLTAAHAGDSGGSSTTKAVFNKNGNLEISDGDLVIGTSGHGINFSVTSDHGTATPSELLDDYEEGSWTPTIKSLSGTDPTISYTKQDGRYTKIGNVVYLFCFIDIGAGNFGTNGTGDGIIDGLPYTISNNPASSDCHGSYSDNLKSIPNTFSAQRNNAMLFFANGAGNIRLHQYSTNNPIYQTGWSLTQMDNGDRFKWGWTAQYRTDQS